jgi:hypothetical protein
MLKLAIQLFIPNSDKSGQQFIKVHNCINCLFIIHDLACYSAPCLIQYRPSFIFNLCLTVASDNGHLALVKLPYANSRP